jgi:hypothetical protein
MLKFEGYAVFIAETSIRPLINMAVVIHGAIYLADLNEPLHHLSQVHFLKPVVEPLYLF